MSIELAMIQPIQWSHPVLSPSSPTFHLSQHHGLFEWVSFSHQVVKGLEFQLQHQSFQWIFGTDLSDWLVWSPCSPRDPKSLLQHHSAKASILLLSVFLYGPTLTSCMTTRKTITLTIWTFVGKIMSLLFNMLSRLVIGFLPRNKRLLISWLQSPSAVILEPPKIKFLTVSPSVCNEVMGSNAMILVFLNVDFYLFIYFLNVEF